MNTNTYNESRRNLLKKAYIAPAVVALGTMSISSEANASSSLSNDGWCKTKVHQKDWNAAKAWHNNEKKSFTQTQDNFRYNSRHAATNAWNSEKYETGVDYWVAKRDGSEWVW